MRYLVVQGTRSGFAELANVFVVEAENEKKACEDAARRAPTTDIGVMHAESLDGLEDGWTFYSDV